MTIKIKEFIVQNVFRSNWLAGILLLFLTASCNDLTDMDSSNINYGVDISEDGTAEMYILCEGLFNQNNSSLAHYSFTKKQLTTSYFKSINKRGLGDTGNDLQLYGNKLYAVINVSSLVEVIDKTTGKALKQIPLLKENGSSRQPRNIAFFGSKAYICSFDGSIARIDTASLSVDGWCTAGRNPDGICVQDGKLYVSNSGGLDANGIGVDKTVSVIDIATFTKTKDIIVGPNPGKIAPGPNHSVLVVTRGEDIKTGDYHLVSISSISDEVLKVYEEPVLNFAVNDNLAYIYSYSYSTQTSSFKVLNLSSGKIVKEKFIADGTSIHTPYYIGVNPYNGDVFITDAYNYTVKGDVLCFNAQGQLRYKLNNIGLNPSYIVFSDKASNSTTDSITQDDTDSLYFANKVWEYMPAPCQFMNTETTAYRTGYNENQVLAYATERICNKELISLGGFGGYIVLGFPAPIPHIEGEYDFKIYGNAYYSIYGTQTGKPGGSAEPGIVWVSADDNKNGKPDDTWYELAGSEYGSANETHNYSIEYSRPTNAKGDVPWTDNTGATGAILRNQYHLQDSYYPAWINDEKLHFSGTRLKNNAVLENGIWVGYCYGWGYADNQPNSTDLCKMKIDWAVDKNGKKVKLEHIDFVRIYTAVNQDVGDIGEISTEVMTIENLHHK